MTEVDDWDERHMVVEFDISETWMTVVHPEDCQGDETPSDVAERRFHESTEPARRATMKIADDAVSPSQMTLRDVHEESYERRRRQEGWFLDYLEDAGGTVEWGGDLREFCDEYDVGITDELHDVFTSLWRSGTIELVDGGTVRLVENDE